MKYTYTPSIPDEFLEIQDAGERKQYLLTILLPLVLKANKEIESERRLVMRIKRTWLWLSKKEKRLLGKLAKKYKVDTGDYDAMVEELLMKVDVLPPSLVLAQAAIESGWGTSRFAVDGNNLFGLRTLSGEGMVPRQQDEGRVFKVSQFDDLQSSIDYYLWNINTHPKYEELRQIRSGSPYPYDPLLLAYGLRHYSEMGDEYVERLISLIEYNRLQDYDAVGLE
ncbi:MAG: glucosaminidase domain-containing protein [Deltaproteobacteria bacterium]|nr:glucosaminidase domain-containing protein [Deltaproteobacteria bacterium]